MTEKPSDNSPPPLLRPLVIEVEDDSPADPAAAPPVPEGDAQGRAMLAAARFTLGKRSAFSRLAIWVFTSLATFILSVSAWNFVTGLFSRNSVLGWIAFVLVLLAIGVALILTVKEVSAFARMARIDRTRIAADMARAAADLKAARAVVADLVGLYGARSDTAWGRARLAEREADVFDADALLLLAETELLAPLDRVALAEVEAAARQVATIAALVPLALADVATALYANIRMIRRLSEIYGGRSGTFNSWQLMRRVFAAVIGAGAIALADDLIGSVAGGGVLSKLSRRFGEGLVNGALTARTGIAAMEVCRPLPFVAQSRPGTSATVSRALKGYFDRNGDPS